MPETFSINTKMNCRNEIERKISKNNFHGESRIDNTIILKLISVINIFIYSYIFVVTITEKIV